MVAVKVEGQNSCLTLWSSSISRERWSPLGTTPRSSPTRTSFGLPGSPEPVRLSSEERRGAAEKRFASLYALHISGITEGRSSNVLSFAGMEVVLTDRPFALFLRLVVALFETEDGFEPRGKMRTGGGLASEGYYAEEDMDRILSEIRKGVPHGAEGNPREEVHRSKPPSGSCLHSPPLRYLE